MLVEIYHYSHYLPANIQFCASEILDNVPIAACFFSIPATRWKEEVLELCRLVRNENIDPKPMLTKLISQAVKQLNREKRFNLLVSFADSTHGHHGGIYQACSWNFHTLRKPSLDGFIVNGVFVCRRTCFHRYKTSSIKLIDILKEKGIECSPHYDNGKYLYWWPLDRHGEDKATRLGLQKMPYPKPNKNHILSGE